MAEPPEAEALLKEGVEFRHKDQNEEALGAFRRAFLIAPTPRVRAQIALAEQALGRWVEAESDLLAALAASTDPWIVKNRPVLDAALVTIQAHLGSLEIDANVSDAEVLIDGKVVAKLPHAEAIRVIAGSVVVQVRATDRQSMERRIEIAAATVRKEHFELMPSARAPAPIIWPPAPSAHNPKPPSEPRPAEAPGGRVVAYSLVGVGLAGLGAGTYFGLRTFKEKELRAEHCDGSRCDDEGLLHDDRARMNATLSTVAFAVGAVGVGVGGWLLFRSPSTNASGVQVSLAAANGWGLRINGAW